MPTVESAAVAQVVSAATINVGKPAGTAEGNLLVAVHVMDMDSPLSAMTAPDGWEQAGPDGMPDTAYICWAKVWVKAAGGAEPSSYTFGAGTGSETLLTVLRISGADPSSPLDFTPVWADGGEVTATAQVAPSGTAVHTGALLIAIYGALTEGANASYTPPAGMTEHSDFPSPSDVWIKMSVASGAIMAPGATGTKTATSTLATRWLAGALAIAPAAARVRIHHAEFSAPAVPRVRIHHASFSAPAAGTARVRIHHAALTVPTAADQVPASGLQELSGTFRPVTTRVKVAGEWL